MKAPQTAPLGTTTNLNHLRRGATYRATTLLGDVTGEYLGIETPHGERAILLRHRHGTASVALVRIESIEPLAA